MASIGEQSRTPASNADGAIIDHARQYQELGTSAPTTPFSVEDSCMAIPSPVMSQSCGLPWLANARDQSNDPSPNSSPYSAFPKPPGLSQWVTNVHDLPKTPEAILGTARRVMVMRKATAHDPNIISEPVNSQSANNTVSACTVQHYAKSIQRRFLSECASADSSIVPDSLTWAAMMRSLAQQYQLALQSQRRGHMEHNENISPVLMNIDDSSSTASIQRRALDEFTSSLVKFVRQTRAQRTSTYLSATSDLERQETSTSSKATRSPAPYLATFTRFDSGNMNSEPKHMSPITLEQLDGHGAAAGLGVPLMTPTAALSSPTAEIQRTSKPLDTIATVQTAAASNQSNTKRSKLRGKILGNVKKLLACCQDPTDSRSENTPANKQAGAPVSPQIRAVAPPRPRRTSPSTSMTKVLSDMTLLAREAEIPYRRSKQNLKVRSEFEADESPSNIHHDNQNMYGDKAYRTDSTVCVISDNDIRNPHSRQDSASLYPPTDPRMLPSDLAISVGPAGHSETWWLSTPSSLERALNTTVSPSPNSPTANDSNSTLHCLGPPTSESLSVPQRPMACQIPRRKSSLNDTVFANTDDRGIDNSAVLKGLAVAVAAACNGEVDGFISAQTGVRLKRFLADLSVFESLMEERFAAGRHGSVGAGREDEDRPDNDNDTRHSLKRQSQDLRRHSVFSMAHNDAQRT